MPYAGHTIVESSRLDQAYLRSLSLVAPLCRNKRRQTVIREFFLSGMRPTPHSRYAPTPLLDAPIPQKAIQHP